MMKFTRGMYLHLEMRIRSNPQNAANPGVGVLTHSDSVENDTSLPQLLLLAPWQLNNSLLSGVGHNSATHFYFNLSTEWIAN